MEIGGNVTDTGGSSVTEYGIIWGTSSLPATGSIKVVCGNGTGQFSTVIHGLMMNVPYYARAYAVNARGTSYGEQKLIRTINYPFLTAPGSYQGWNPADTSTVITSVNLDGNYEGYIWFPANMEMTMPMEPSKRGEATSWLPVPDFTPLFLISVNRCINIR